MACRVTNSANPTGSCGTSEEGEEHEVPTSGELDAVMLYPLPALHVYMLGSLIHPHPDLLNYLAALYSCNPSILHPSLSPMRSYIEGGSGLTAASTS